MSVKSVEASFFAVLRDLQSFAGHADAASFVQRLSINSIASRAV